MEVGKEENKTGEENIALKVGKPEGRKGKT